MNQRLNVDIGSVLSLPLKLVVVWNRSISGTVQSILNDAITVARCVQWRKVIECQDFVGVFVSEDIGKGLVGENRSPILFDKNTLDRALHEAAVLVLALPQCLFRPFEFGDIDEGQCHATVRRP